MLRGFRHTLFLILQVGVLLSAAAAWLIWPEAWRPIVVCALGAVIASIVCERIARHYLRTSLGRLRRTAEEISRSNGASQIDVQPGEDFYKLVKAINHVAHRLAEASEHERALQQELRRRERLAFLGELAATVAHELNNPLDGLQNCVRILRRSGDNPQRAEQMLELIDNGLQRIDLIVRRLLTLARENVVRPTDARISTIVDAAIETVRAKCDSAGITIHRDGQAADPRVRVDELLLEHVFLNLLTNAVDSMPGGGEIHVRVGCEAVPGSAGRSECIRVRIEDSGCGIPADAVPHIFEPFYTTKEGGRGTGLGLSIAARIVEAHHGMIHAEPRAGGGAVFTVRIPARDAQTTSRGDAVVTASAASAQG
jgi:signal transduction histidine kinase